MGTESKPKYRAVILTDFQIHAVAPVNPRPIDRQVDRAIRANRPGRAYTTDFQMTPDGKLHFSFPTHDPDGTPIKYFMPKGGINVFFAPDMIDKLNSLAKNSN